MVLYKNRIRNVLYNQLKSNQTEKEAQLFYVGGTCCHRVVRNVGVEEDLQVATSDVGNTRFVHDSKVEDSLRKQN